MIPISRKRHFQETRPSPLLNLPNDVFALIFTYLKKRDISSVFLSCKRFQRIIDQWPKDYVQPYVESRPFKTSKDIAFINKFAPRLETFALKNVKFCEFSEIANLVDKVTHIRSHFAHISEPDTFTIFNKLASLDLKNAFIRTVQIPLPESLTKLSIGSEDISKVMLPAGLKRLKVAEIPAAEHYRSFKNLESLQIYASGPFADVFSLSPCPLTEFKGVLYYRSSSSEFQVPYLISKGQGENPVFQLGECLYEGPLENYFPSGEGLLKYKGKVVFQGIFKKGFIVSGQGSLVLNMAAISNFWTNSVTVHYHNGSTFTGNFNGQGISTDPFGRSFKGIFQDRKPVSGSGFVSYGEEWYEGRLIDGKFQGFARFHSGGTLYEGHFENDKPVGSFLVTMPGRAPFKTNHPNIQ
jgi:hypothetical protein